MMQSFEITAKSELETVAIAKIISSELNLGDLLILDGDLGTGKTLFTKALSEELGTKNEVTSPTYSIANFYKLEKGNIIHIDAYRLADIQEFRELGLDDYFSEAIVVIEWGSKVIEDFDEYLFLSFKHNHPQNQSRKIQLSGLGNIWELKSSSLKSKLSDYIK